MFISRCKKYGLGKKYCLSAPAFWLICAFFNLTLNQFSDILPRASSGLRWSVKIGKWGRRDLIKIYCLLHSSGKWVYVSKKSKIYGNLRSKIQSRFTTCCGDLSTRPLTSNQFWMVHTRVVTFTLVVCPNLSLVGKYFWDSVGTYFYFAQLCKKIEF